MESHMTVGYSFNAIGFELRVWLPWLLPKLRPIRILAFVWASHSSWMHFCQRMAAQDFLKFTVNFASNKRKENWLKTLFLQVYVVVFIYVCIKGHYFEIRSPVELERNLLSILGNWNWNCKLKESAAIKNRTLSIQLPSINVAPQTLSLPNLT